MTRARVALPRAIWAGIYGKRRLREIDRRIRFLSARLESAEVVEPKQQKKLDQVFFGATVT